MEDEKFFLIANDEFEEGDKQPALWIKALTLAGGSEEKAKHQYILLRVEQLKREKQSDVIKVKYDAINYISLFFGIIIAIYIYFINFDAFSETTLVRITPLWFIPFVFGYYGFVCQRLEVRLHGSEFYYISDLLYSDIGKSRSFIGSLISFCVHAPLIIIKSKKPKLVLFGGTAIWLLLLLIFFEVIFPAL